MSKYLVAYTCNIKPEYDQTYTMKIGREVLEADDLALSNISEELSRWAEELEEKYKGIINVSVISFSKLD